MGILKTNLALQQDYCSHPNFIGFDKINIELVSMMFNVKVSVYHVTEDEWLSAKMVNKNYKKSIDLSDHQNHYDALYSKEHLDNAFDIQ